MNTTRERIINDIKIALKGGDRMVVETLRMLQSEINNAAIAKRSTKMELCEEDVITVIKKEVKKRKESITIYSNAGRNDLASKETVELEVLKMYLPQEMEVADIERIVKEVISGGVNNFGDIMKTVLHKTAGMADGRTISEIIKRNL
ncbi:MAG: GatB/YqeY domain-containing protein [bacterium]